MRRSAYEPRHLERLSKLLSVVPVDHPDELPMTLGELNGFLVGIATSPDRVTLDAWLPCIWGGDRPLRLRDLPLAQALIDEVIAHYNAITRQLHESWTCELVFDQGERGRDILWESWVAGFEVSLLLAPFGWKRLQNSSDEDASSALSLLMALHAIDMGSTSLTKRQSDALEKSAPDLLPHAVEAFHRWRHKRDPFRGREHLKAPNAAAFIQSKAVSPFPANLAPDRLTGHGCLCGSGRQYLRCCGAN